jgi:hypothetical protein
MIILWQPTGQLKVYNGSAFVPVSGSAPVGPTDIVLSNTSVLEQSAQGFVVGTLGADQAGCTFSLVSGATSFFQIVGNSLQCSATPLFYSAATSRSITIRATNTVGLTVDETFVIAVTQIVTTGGGGGTPALGTPDAVGAVSTVNHAFATSTSAGYTGSLPLASTLTTNASSPVYRSGTQIIMQGTNPVLTGYDCRGYNVELRVDNCTVTYCLFNATQGGNRTIYADNTDLGAGHTIDHNTFDGESQTSGHRTPSSSSLRHRVHQKSVSYNKFINTQTDMLMTFGGSCGLIVWNYFSKVGMRTLALTRIVLRLNAGYPNQKRTTDRL